MSVINEISRIKNIMGLKPLTESSGGPISQIFDNLSYYLKSLIKNEDSLSKFIRNGFDEESLKSLKDEIVKNPHYGEELITQLTNAKIDLNPNSATRFYIDKRIKEIENLIPTLTFKNLSLEAQSLFTKTGKKLTSDEVSFLNDASEKIYNGVQKLDKKDVLILTNQLENLGQNIENAITKLNKSNDIINRQKAQVLQQAWDKYSKQLKIIVDGIGKFPLMKTLFSLSKVTLGVVAILTLTGLYFTLKNTPFGKWISGIISNIPNSFSSTSEPENTGGGSNKQGGGSSNSGENKGKYSDLK
jgi:hypothetical protein